MKICEKQKATGSDFRIHYVFKLTSERFLEQDIHAGTKGSFKFNEMQISDPVFYSLARMVKIYG